MSATNRFERYLAARLSHLAPEVTFRWRLAWRHWLRWIVDRAGDRYFDKKFGIISSKRRSLAQLGLDLPDCIDYQPVSYCDFRKLLDAISIHPGDVFLDFGSGMGRALCLAALYPFRSVIGVEISPELCQTARENINHIRAKLRCQDIQIVNANVIDYKIRPDASILYFFNPFVGDVMTAVLDKIAMSAREAPRHLLIVFYGTASSENFREAAKQCRWLALRSETVLPTGAVSLTYSNTEWTGEVSAGLSGDSSESTAVIH